MQLLQQQGKIRYWGLSLNTFEPGADADFLIKNNLGNGFQLVLNIINQNAIALMKSAAAKGYGIIARMPLQFGLLTGKYDKAPTFSENDHRKNRLTKEVIDVSLAATGPVWKLCSKYSCTKTQLALSYILSYKEVSTVIPGIRTAEQVELNTTNLFQLQPEDISLIENLGSTDFVMLMELIKKQG